MEDKNVIMRKVWDGNIPVCIQLNSDEVPSETPTLPSPFFILIPRVTYFPLVLEKIIRQLRVQLTTSSASSGSVADLATAAGEVTDSSYWLSTPNDTPLKWHYPVGLLFDMHAGPSEKLPWEISVHFNSYPSDVLLAPPVSPKAVESIFQATLKEADQLKHRGRGGPGPVFCQLLPHQTKQLWTGLLQHRFEQFWSINQRFMQGAPIVEISQQQASLEHKDDGTAKKEATDDEEAREATDATLVSHEDPASLLVASGAMKAFRHCPIRLYFSPCQATGVPISSAYLQCLVPPFHEVERTPNTLSEAIDTLFKSRTALKSSSCIRKDDYVFVMHGVEIPLETPIQWMCENMAYPDNFLHVVARRREVQP